MRWPCRIFLAAVLVGGLWGAATPALAQDTVGQGQTGLIVNCDKRLPKLNADGAPVIDPATHEQVTQIYHDCTLDDFLQQFVILIRWGMRIMVFFAVLALVYGGWHFITAAGRSEKIADGKNVITGTITGILISLTAYIIVNFTVSAITGSQVQSINPFQGFIAQVFPKQSEQRPFSGPAVKTGPNPVSCRENWDNNCSDHVFCSDPGTTVGNITDFQKDLGVLGCNCGTIDGCFGAATVSCVRQFQAAQFLPLTGIYDSATSEKVTGLLGRLKSCDGNADPATCRQGILATEARCTDPETLRIVNALPKPTTQSLEAASSSGRGCCIVGTNGGPAGLNSLYCASKIDQQACLSLGQDNIYLPGVDCQSAPQAKQYCGFCSACDDACLQANQTPPYTEPYSHASCIAGTDGVGPSWCTGVANPPLFYFGGQACTNNPRCGNPSICIKEVRTKAP